MRKMLLVTVVALSGSLFANDIDTAIKKGVEYLAAQQRQDGHFSDPQMPALTALPLWAMVSAGRSDENVTNAVNFVLKTQRPDGGFYVPKPGRGGSGLGNYNTSVCLSALYESKLAPTRAILDARTYIASSQLTGDDTMAGGFGYDRLSRRRYADMSNSGYAFDAMRRTEGAEDFRPAGERRADLDWDKALKFIESHQAKDGDQKGGFVYNERTPQAGTVTNNAGKVSIRASGAMTYSGVLSMCHARLTKSDPRVRAALDFCARNWTLEESPGQGMQGLYYYYDIMARALDASKVETFKCDGRTIDWKKELAAKLISLQREDGSWVNDNNRFWENDPVLVTSFAVLSLSLCR